MPKPWQIEEGRGVSNRYSQRIEDTLWLEQLRLTLIAVDTSIATTAVARVAIDGYWILDARSVFTRS